MTHATTLLAFGVTIAALVILRRRLGREDPGRADRFDRRLGAGAIAIWALTTFVQFLPRYYDRAISLPLQLCDFTLIAVPVGLLTGWRPARAITYFWGVGLSTQGLITPDLDGGPATMRFWYFWLPHFVIVGGALYGVAARGYRPTWRDFRVATLTGIVYVALVLPFDLLTNLNYGYVGQSAPGQPSLVDSLGPWPGRVGVMLGLGVAVMALLMLPWEIVRRREGRRESHAAAEPAGAGVPHSGHRSAAGLPRRS